MTFEHLTPLQIGDTAPNFTLPSAAGPEYTLSVVLKEKPVVLVFGLVAFTGLCTAEACELRDNVALFQDSRAELLVVSEDTKFSLRVWGEQEGLDFPLLSDYWPHGAVAKSYGVLLEETGLAARGTFLIGQDGLVKAAFVQPRGEARPLDAYREALASLV